jgi:hypothetical protein
VTEKDDRSVLVGLQSAVPPIFKDLVKKYLDMKKLKEVIVELDFLVIFEDWVGI